MTTPNEELIADLQQLANEIEISYRIESIEEAVKALQSQAERIAELEDRITELTSEEHSIPELRQMLDDSYDEKQKCYFAVSQYQRATANLLAERDELRAQLAAIAATEPVAYRWVWKSKPHDIEGWCYTSTPPNSPELQEIEKLFTRPMPADVTELVEALEKLARLGNGDQYGNSDGNMIARKALSKYKGAK